MRSGKTSCINKQLLIEQQSIYTPTAVHSIGTIQLIGYVWILYMFIANLHFGGSTYLLKFNHACLRKEKLIVEFCKLGTSIAHRDRLYLIRYTSTQTPLMDHRRCS